MLLCPKCPKPKNYSHFQVRRVDAGVILSLHIAAMTGTDVRLIMWWKRALNPQTLWHAPSIPFYLTILGSTFIPWLWLSLFYSPSVPTVNKTFLFGIQMENITFQPLGWPITSFSFSFIYFIIIFIELKVYEINLKNNCMDPDPDLLGIQPHLVESLIKWHVFRVVVLNVHVKIGASSC